MRLVLRKTTVNHSQPLPTQRILWAFHRFAESAIINKKSEETSSPPDKNLNSRRKPRLRIILFADYGRAAEMIQNLGVGLCLSDKIRDDRRHVVSTTEHPDIDQSH